MSRAIRNFLGNEERAGNIVVGGATCVIVAGFVVAVVAMLVLR